MGSQGIISGAVRAKTSTRASAEREERSRPTRVRRQAPAKAKGSRGAQGQGRPKGIKTPKRSPVELKGLENRFLAFVRASPGLRIEQINTKLGTTTKELALPVRRLVTAGRIKTKGVVRSTQYFPTGRK